MVVAVVVRWCCCESMSKEEWNEKKKKGWKGMVLREWDFMCNG